MTWGAKQGCRFVETRCGQRIDDLSLTMSTTGTNSACHRDYKRSYGGIAAHTATTNLQFPTNSLLATKCGQVSCGGCPRTLLTGRDGLDTVAHAACAACAARGGGDSPGARAPGSHPECHRVWSTVSKEDGETSDGSRCNAECLDMGRASAQEKSQLGCTAVPPGAIRASGSSAKRSTVCSSPLAPGTAVANRQTLLRCSHAAVVVCRRSGGGWLPGQCDGVVRRRSVTGDFSLPLAGVLATHKVKLSVHRVWGRVHQYRHDHHR
jgi:hypothetical protein